MRYECDQLDQEVYDMFVDMVHVKKKQDKSDKTDRRLRRLANYHHWMLGHGGSNHGRE